MCGRYTLSAPGEAIRELVRGEGDVDLGAVGALEPRYNIAPTQPIALLRRENHRLRLVLAHWGLIPNWAKDPAIGARLINARSESVRDKPAFRDSFAVRRCWVPADGFYEWVAAHAGPAGSHGRRGGRAAGGRRQAYLIRRQDRRPFAFAGLWDRWVDRATGGILDSATILTCPPNPLVAPLHDRMPVMFFTAEERHAWTSDTERPEDLLALLRPADGSAMEAFAVGPRVNRSDEDSPECIAPAAATGETPSQRQGALFR
jgi:putative SOS response-associated peptidase YedK